MSFLTGSYVYGKPTPDSDVDLVVQLSPDQLGPLVLLADKPDTKIYPGCVPLRFGKLNLIVCTDKPHYDAWWTATEAAKEWAKSTGRRLDKETVVASFQETFANCNLDQE